MHFKREEKAIRDQLNTFSACKSPCSRSHSNKSNLTCIYLFATGTDYKLSKCVQKNDISKSEAFYIQIFEGTFCIFKNQKMAIVTCVISKSNEVFAEPNEIKWGGKHRLDLADPSNREKQPDKIRCIRNATVLLISLPTEVSSYSSSMWVVMDNQLNPY